jgi:iron complex outermembrane receptor protein
MQLTAGNGSVGVDMKNLHRSVSSLVALSVALGAGTAFAQDAQSGANGSESSPYEIVVTAQRRAEKSVDVPITITSLNANALDNAGVKQLSDISKIVPSLRFDKTGVFSQPTIRGVGTAIATSGGGPNVATYVDGFFLPSSAASDFQLMRTNSIQVLKGPQGTLFGRNTTGGAILVTTSDPSETPEAEVRASYSRFATAELQGYATGGVAEGLAVDLMATIRVANMNAGPFAAALRPRLRRTFRCWSVIRIRKRPIPAL